MWKTLQTSELCENAPETIKKEVHFVLSGATWEARNGLCTVDKSAERKQ